jgi:hypothetical protein
MTSRFILWALLFAETATYCSAGESIGENGALFSSKIEIKVNAMFGKYWFWGLDCIYEFSRA